MYNFIYIIILSHFVIYTAWWWLIYVVDTCSCFILGIIKVVYRRLMFFVLLTSKHKDNSPEWKWRIRLDICLQRYRITHMKCKIFVLKIFVIVYILYILTILIKRLYLTSHMHIYNINCHCYVPLLRTSLVMIMLMPKHVEGTL